MNARELAREILILDGHIDVPFRLQKSLDASGEPTEDVTRRTAGGDFDLPRAREGGLDAAFMSIYIPARYQQTGGAKALADRLIDMVEGFARRAPDGFAMARSPDEVEDLFRQGKFSLLLGMENGAALEGDLDNLHHFYRRGVRYVTLTHSRDNDICDSSYDTSRTWKGLSPFGRTVVAEMNRLGVLVDVAHVSDDAFWEVLHRSETPVVATHSSCRFFTPGWERNMSDEMIEALAQKGGVIMINFGSGFLTEEIQKARERRREAIDAFARERRLDREAPEVLAFGEAYDRENPPVLADVTDVADHIDHVVEIAGIDHVGLGSDFDGVGDTLPSGLKDVSMYPNLLATLLERGYSRTDLAKLGAENLFRVFRAVEAHARVAR